MGEPYPHMQPNATLGPALEGDCSALYLARAKGGAASALVTRAEQLARQPSPWDSVVLRLGGYHGRYW